MTNIKLTKALYRFVARLDDDPWIRDTRLREHAHLLRQEMKDIHPEADMWLFPTKEQS